MSGNLYLLQASVIRSQSVTSNPVLLCETTCLQVICPLLQCVFLISVIAHFERRKYHLSLSSLTDVCSHSLSQCRLSLAGKDMANTWLVPQLQGCETWYNLSCHVSFLSLSAVVWRDVSLELILPYFACKGCSSSCKDCKSEGRDCLQQEREFWCWALVGSGSRSFFSQFLGMWNKHEMKIWHLAPCIPS